MTNRPDLDGWLRGRRRVIVLTHARPDGDALGAAAGIAHAAESAGALAEVALFDPLPARYEFLRSAARWTQWTDAHRDTLKQGRAQDAFDGVAIVDTCASAQLTPAADCLPTAPPILVVDHHRTRDPIAERPGDLVWIDESAGAASLLVTEWLETRLGSTAWRPEVALALFVGIATDTGWFRHSNADARVFAAASRLIAHGVHPSELYEQLYQNDALPRLRLVARMFSNLELRADGRLAVLQLRATDFLAAGADESATEDLVNEANRLAGLEALLLFVERPDGAMRVNFRSRHTLDVAALARTFGGGGHARAAGARPPGTWDAVVPAVIAATEAALAAAGCGNRGSA